MQAIIESIYWHGSGTVCSCLNRLLKDVLSCAPAIILKIFFCRVKIFLLFEELPQKISPYFITVNVLTVN